jgi:hypothetical protein
MRPENTRMKEFLEKNGIDAIPWFIWRGSMKGCWRLYGKKRGGGSWENYQKWTPELREKLTDLGFLDFDGKPLKEYSGNGGIFQVFVRGHLEFIEGVAIPRN